jgi:hypothetical protein
MKRDPRLVDVNRRLDVLSGLLVVEERKPDDLAVLRQDVAALRLIVDGLGQRQRHDASSLHEYVRWLRHEWIPGAGVERRPRLTLVAGGDRLART